MKIIIFVSRPIKVHSVILKLGSETHTERFYQLQTQKRLSRNSDTYKIKYNNSHLNAHLHWTQFPTQFPRITDLFVVPEKSVLLGTSQPFVSCNSNYSSTLVEAVTTTTMNNHIK